MSLRTFLARTFRSRTWTPIVGGRAASIGVGIEFKPAPRRPHFRSLSRHAQFTPLQRRLHYTARDDDR